ncbi:MAG TPA: hypothetical protein VG075_02000 [Candidatus Acidoferrum sp.]|nr:hypothetical protein [Candidatus Acidoferrum sp.]
MPCSSCHEAWPKLSPFGQQFKDNGYQMGNDRDAPIFQQPAYWPVTFRITPIWHRESTDKVQVDGSNGPGGNEATVTTHGFDWSGLDFHTAGTLANNYSFYVLPSSDNTAAFHFESVWARIDNIAGSSWLNVKLGKFELDNLLSEKRILTLTNVSGVYTNYHFQPVGEAYKFGIGDNQVGVEWMGHSKNDRTRVSASLLSASDGQPGLPTSRAYNGYFAASQAFEAGSLGLQRVGGFAYIGQAPTYFQFTNGGGGLNGTGIGNKGFQRYGLIGMWYVKKFDITTIFFHSHDSAYLGTNTPSGGPLNPTGALPAGAHAPTWNGGLFESHYNFNPQLILINRYELVRMSQQALDTNPGNLGNANVLTFGARYYPFISSRAGFAYHGEYAIIWQKGVSPVTFTNQTTSSLLFGFDFAF